MPHRKHLRAFPRGRRVAQLLALTLSLADALPLSAQNQSASPNSFDTAAWLHETQQWRAQRAADLSAPNGPLSVADVEWLKTGVNSIGAAAGNGLQIAHAPDHIGLLTVSGKLPGNAIVQLLAPPGGFPADLEIDGKPAREGPLDAGDQHPSVITWHGLSLAVVGRGDRFALRINDADAANRSGFHGLRWFPANPEFRVNARWIPNPPRQVEKIPTALGTKIEMPAPGVAEFLLDGKVVVLEAVIEGGDTSKLLFILSDKTGPAATNAGGRYLTTDLPDHGLDKPGNLVLDLNRLSNPPCAYTQSATCAMPPERSRLPIEIEAGELRYLR
ncbi:MAG TPA: DUF1684 domain-containing protein [Terracidiphilus sp.]|nr:DUF1684 domain-containing protein [Terracidiphilus sp.]